MWMLALLLSVVPAADTPPLKEVACLRAEAPVTVDGAPSDEAWAGAEIVRDFRLWGTLGKPASETALRLCYDDRYLYALFECADDDIFTLYNERDAHLWEADVVELFFEPAPLLGRDVPIYYEFQVAPNNAVFDARMVNSGSGGFRRWAEWDCGMRTAVEVDGSINDWENRDGGYTVEIAIPLAAFSETIGDEPLNGQVWKFVGARADFGVRFEREQRSATGNIAQTPHDREGFFTLHFK